MSDQATAPTSSSAVGEEIARSLSSIWQRRSGTRPSAATTEIANDVVRCVMEGAVGNPPPEPNEGETAHDERIASPDSREYRQEAVTAVAKLTKRKVKAFVPKRDEKTGAATETFILEAKRVNY